MSSDIKGCKKGKDQMSGEIVLSLIFVDSNQEIVPIRRAHLKANGIGLCDEYPSIRYPGALGHHGYDRKIELSVNSFGGAEGVKFEEQAKIIETGVEFLQTYAYETQL